MPRNHTGLTNEQRAAIVENAHRCLAGGASVTEAATAAAEPYGIAEVTVRRYCEAAGRPLTHGSERTQAARQAVQLFTAERTRTLVQRLLGVMEEETDLLVKQKAGQRSLVDAQRVANTVARLASTNESLLAALGPSAGPGAANDELENDAAAPFLSPRMLAEWRRDVAILEGQMSHEQAEAAYERGEFDHDDPESAIDR